MSELSDLLRSALPKGWSGREVSRKAEAKGHKLSAATVNNYLGGRHGVPDDETIAAFVAVLPVSEREIRAAAGVSVAGTPWEPPESARYLSADQRRALSLLISTMTERREDVRNDDRSAPTSKAGESPATVTHLDPSLPRAAHPRKGKDSEGRQKRRQMDEAGEESQDPGE